MMTHSGSPLELWIFLMLCAGILWKIHSLRGNNRMGKIFKHIYWLVSCMSMFVSLSFCVCFKTIFLIIHSFLIKVGLPILVMHCRLTKCSKLSGKKKQLVFYYRWIRNSRREWWGQFISVVWSLGPQLGDWNVWGWAEQLGQRLLLWCLVPGIRYSGVWAQLRLSARDCLLTCGSPYDLDTHCMVTLGGWIDDMAAQGSDSIVVSKVETAWHWIA